MAADRSAETLRVVLIALALNVAIAIAKFIGAYLSGSRAMAAEGLHSVVDSFNEVFLYLGLRLQHRAPSERHPFGYGRERFFWSFVAAVFVFAFGALTSLYLGITHWLSPEPIRHAGWSLGILGVTFAFDSASFVVSYREFKQRAASFQLRPWRYFGVTRDSTLAAVVAEDTAALIGAAMAALGIALSALTHDARFDAAASVGVGVLLTVLAYVIGVKSRALLLGQGASQEELRRVMAVFEGAPELARVLSCYTMLLAPEELLLACRVEVRSSLTMPEVDDLFDRLEARLIEAVPSLTEDRIFLEAENAEALEPAPD